jgi:uncharacterized repeat protein (TIGR03803 family)
MVHSRALASLLATISLLAAPLAHAAIGIPPIADQDIPSGKTLVVPIPATDIGGPARSYTVSVAPPTISGTTTPTTVAGVNAVVRTGDPHFTLGVMYSDSNSVMQTGTMEFQMLREFTPMTTQVIAGLTQSGFYSPTLVDGSTKYITFHRIVPGFVIQGGDPLGTGQGGPGFSFKSEFSNALIYSGSMGQLAMANSNTNSNSSGVSLENGNTNGSQFFITLASDRPDLDYGYTLFGQILRGYDTLTGIAGTPLETNSNGVVVPVTPVDITSATISQNNTDAVLLLSATGVCDAVVTVTASSGGASTVQTFTAHAVADTMSDPPFPQPPPDIAAPNGKVNVTLQATDLQLDLIRYGYIRFLPASDSSITSGTSPIVSIPLISNTDNIVGAEVDRWNGSPRGFAGFPFQIGAGVKALHGALSPIPPGYMGGFNKLADPLAVFTSANPKDTAAGFTATVNCGDGTLISGSNVSVVKDGAGRFKLIASHTYESPGEYPLLVQIDDPGGASLTLTGTTFISPYVIAISANDVSGAKGALKNTVLATFKDYGSTATAADYTATVNWGDGSVSPGTLRSIGGSSFQILGSHVYQNPDSYTLSTSVIRGANSNYSASTWTTARISGVSAPQVFPPFPQAHLAQIWSPVYSDSNTITTSGSSSGGNPYSSLLLGNDGNFYGTTSQGGVNNEGTVFQMTPGGTLTTLHSFGALVSGTNADGATPVAGLITGTDGNLYGTAKNGGLYGFGSVYQITTGGSFTTLYSFTDGADGANPYAALVNGTDGNFYGTAEAGGAANAGTVYQLTYSGSLTVIYTFLDDADGANPYSSLISATDGNLYGTNQVGSAGNGTVYKLTYSGSLTTLFAFGGSDGATPFAPVVQGADGNFYGTTVGGGVNGEGTVYEVPFGGGLITLHSFGGGTDGANPYGGLVSSGTDGSFFGTTEAGGAGGNGTIFQIFPNGINSTLNTLHTFSSIADGANPYDALISGSDGYFYGTAEEGGANGDGTVFRISPGGSFTALVQFSTGDTFQLALRASVAIVNSGDRPSLPGSFSVYVDPNGVLDGEATQLSSDGKNSFPIPALLPGKYAIITFYLEGSVVDTRLKFPLGFNPAGQSILGVVTYTDPIGDFDGSQKVISPGSF